MTALASKAEPNSTRLLLIPVTVSVAMHFALLWGLTQTEAPQTYGNEVITESVMQVQIWQPALEKSVVTRVTPNKKPAVLKSTAVSADTIRAQVTTGRTAATQSEQGEVGPQAGIVPDLEQELNKAAVGKILLHPGYLNLQPQAQSQPRSVAELAREQLNTGEHKSAIADGIKAAVVPDCKDDAGLGLLGLPVIIYKAANGKCK